MMQSPHLEMLQEVIRLIRKPLWCLFQPIVLQCPFFMWHSPFFVFSPYKFLFQGFFDIQSSHIYLGNL